MTSPLPHDQECLPFSVTETRLGHGRGQHSGKRAHVFVLGEADQALNHLLGGVFVGNGNSRSQVGYGDAEDPNLVTAIHDADRKSADPPGSGEADEPGSLGR